MPQAKKMTSREAGEAFVKSVAEQSARTGNKRRTKDFYEALRCVNGCAELDGVEIANRNFNLETIEGMLDCTVDPDYLEKASTAELDDLIAAYFKTTMFSMVKQMDTRAKAAMHAHRGHQAEK